MSNQQDLYSLAYISMNQIGGDVEEVNETIQDILRKAHSNNPKKDISGALLYSGGYFCQVIEGPEDALAELFEIIQNDERHSNITVLHFEPIDERIFATWAMAFAGIEKDARFDIDGVISSKDKLLVKASGKDLVDSLDALIKQHEQVLTV